MPKGRDQMSSRRGGGSVRGHRGQTHHTEDSRQVGRPLPRCRGGWFVQGYGLSVPSASAGAGPYRCPTALSAPAFYAPDPVAETVARPPPELPAALRGGCTARRVDGLGSRSEKALWDVKLA